MGFIGRGGFSRGGGKGEVKNVCGRNRLRDLPLKGKGREKRGDDFPVRRLEGGVLGGPVLIH